LSSVALAATVGQEDIAKRCDVCATRPSLRLWNVWQNLPARRVECGALGRQLPETSRWTCLRAQSREQAKLVSQYAPTDAALNDPSMSRRSAAALAVRAREIRSSISAVNSASLSLVFEACRTP